MINMLVREQPPMCLHVLGQPLVEALYYQGRRSYCAVQVIVQSPELLAAVRALDPKAAQQLEDAVKEVECEHCGGKGEKVGECGGEPRLMRCSACAGRGTVFPSES